MKVVHFSPLFFDAQSMLGGAERYAWELARAMAKKAECEFISFSDQPLERKDGALKVRLLPRTWNVGGESINPLPLGVRQCVHRADVVQCYQQRTLLTDALLISAHVYHKPLFIGDMGGGAKWALSYHLPLERWAKGYTILSQDCLAYGDIPKEKAHVVYGGVDTDRFFPTGESYDRRRVLFVGRSIPAKGIEILIEALPKDLELTIVGSPVNVDYRAKIVHMAADKKVKFITAISDQELVQLYRTSLVTVLPSIDRMEKLGLVLLESMACGTPVICSRIGGMPEIVDEAKTGFIVPPKDVEALRDRLQWFYDHPSDRDEMGKAGRAWVLNRFSWDKIAERHLEIYRRAA